MDMPRTIRLIQLEEGCRLRAYKDSRGFQTVGYGYNLEAHGYSPEEASAVVWTQAQADEALRDEVDMVVHQLDQRWPDWRQLDDVRQAAIISSVYQLGAPGAAKFLATIAALKARDWDKAADQMLASRWAKQTPKRVARNAAMIRSGSWPREVNGEAFALEAENPKPSPTLSESLPPLLPASGLPNTQTTSPIYLADVRPPVRTDSVVEVLKTLAQSKTMGGVVGLLALQLLGIDKWDVALRIHDMIYPVPDLSQYLAVGLAGLATWGRVTAKPVGGKP